MKYPLLLIAIFLSSPAWSIDHEKIVQGLEALGEYDAAYPFAYQIAQQKNTYSVWRDVAAKYANSDTKGKAFLQAWRQAQALNQESTYKDFLKIRPNALLNIQAIHAIFELIKASHTMTDYVRFMKDFPDAIESVEALLKIQGLAFERAKKAHEALVYDAFVTTFPGAKQIPEAIDLAFQAEQQLIEKEVKGWEEDFKKNYIGTTPVDTFIGWMLEDKARDLVNEAELAFRRNNDLVAVRQYRLLRLEIFKQTETVTEELRQKSTREYEQWLESQQAAIDNSLNEMKYSLIKAIQWQTQHLKAPIVDQSQKLDEVIANYNRFVAQLAEQDKTIFFERSLIMVYVVAPLSIKQQQEKIFALKPKDIK
ncbi:hypothetical protein PN36_00215 [Candidatus Thiomargarita nelsonii]|uniref:Secreted protein n=1 Tax=Candidatus Thiomargarita nelsonii TaxID=1003181 RepID=A0A0A6PNU5_9GAMM|nr:hypothetical protein PN36_00215 [Candidatus Thiomargarita nelsonii]